MSFGSSGLPPSLARLALALGRLPSVGPKTALRMAVSLLRRPREEAEDLATALREARVRVRPCRTCGFYSEEENCSICSDPLRDDGILLVVEAPQDVLAFERTGRFRGRYHVLGGRLSPIEGIGPDALSVEPLLARAASAREVVLALDADAEGEATSLYLAERLKQSTAPGGEIRVTRLAQGLPVGGDLEYADEATLAEAFDGRRGYRR